MKTKDGFIQGYNAQAAVDATAQVIVARARRQARATNINWSRSPTRSKPIWAKKPTQLSADAGYCSDANLAALEERRNRRLYRAGAGQARGKEEGGEARVAAMQKKIRAGGHEAPYRLKAATRAGVRLDQAGARLSPVPFARRGEGRQEWGLVCLAHNILKLAHGALVLAAA